MAVSALVLCVLFVSVAKAKQYAVEFNKGQIALENKDYKGAIEHLQKYTAERPDDDIGIRHAWSAFQAQGRFDEAVREYERGLAHRS